MLQTLPDLQEPDKLGTLIQIRQSMDKINEIDLVSSSKLLLNILTTDQLKTVLFVGMEYIRDTLEYPQLFAMRSIFRKCIENKTKKENKNKDCDYGSNIFPMVEKDASLSKTIPTDIISNYICSYLDLLSIYQFSKCDRNIAIICHTPSAINYLQFNYKNPYRYDNTSHSEYCLDSDHLSHHEDIHLIRNVSRLSITRNSNIEQLMEKLKYLNNVKYLTIYDVLRMDLDNELTEMDINPLLEDWKCIQYKWPLMHSLQNITFESICELPFILSILNKYEIHRFNNISFLNCHFYRLELYKNVVEWDENIIGTVDLSESYNQYKTMLDFILPSKSNNLEILKFEKSFFLKTEDIRCNETNQEFNNLDRILSSLSKLKGIVYSKLNEWDPDIEDEDDIFYNLTHKILENISMFKQLKSIHTHTNDEDDEEGNLLGLYLNTTNIDIFSQIEEICISLSLSNEGAELINNMKELADTKLFNIHKLCLVIAIPSEKHQKNIDGLTKMIKAILYQCEQLEVFQMVCKIENVEYNKECKECEPKFKVLHNILNEVNEIFQNISISYHESDRLSKKRIISKFHIRSSHYVHDSDCSALSFCKMKELMDLLKIMSVNYLSSFPIGKIQIKVSWSNTNYYLRLFRRLLPLQKIFDLQYLDAAGDVITRERYLRNSIDHSAQSVSIQNKSDKIGVIMNISWITDCTYCDNTPWS